MRRDRSRRGARGSYAVSTAAVSAARRMIERGASPRYRRSGGLLSRQCVERLENRTLLSSVTLSIPTGMNAFQGGIVAVPVNVNQLNDGGSHTGISSADFAINFDPSVFTVSSSDVHLGTVPVSGVSWTDTVNQASGQLGINVTNTWKPIASTLGDSLVTIDFHVKGGAPTGLTTISLQGTNSQGVTDLFDQNGSAYTLTPAPPDPSLNGSVDVLASPSPTLGSWTPAPNLTLSPSQFGPNGIGTMLLLTDGTVMATGGQNGNSQDWYQLTPDTSGSYESGTWTKMADMSTLRRFYGSVVMQDGRVMVVGGEYSTILGAISTAVGTATTPITITTVNPLPFNLTSGAAVTISGVSGFGAANGNFSSITVTGSNSFTIDGTTGTVGSGTGGTWLAGVGDSNTGEIFTPPATPGGSGSWQNIANFPQNSFGDGQLELMSDGTVLAGFLGNGQTYRYTPSTDSWATDAVMLNGDRPNEEAWTKLSDGSILTYEIFGSQPQTGQRFVPGATVSADQWVPANSVPVKLATPGVSASDTITTVNGPGGGTDVTITSTIHLPAALTTGATVSLSGISGSIGAALNGNQYKITITGSNTFTLDSTGSITGSGTGGSWSIGLVSGFELGPGFLLPDGRVFQIGATTGTALYTPPSLGNPQGSWTVGPYIPFGLGANDAPGAVLPNGRVLFAASGTPGFGNNTTLFEYDPVSNTINQVTNLPPALQSNLNGEPAFVTRMLVLPSGQVLITDSTGQSWLYKDAGSPQNSWRPTITSIMQNGDGSYTLTGTQITGLSEGAAYGDDAQMATNYPIVQIQTMGGQTLYAKTFNWSTAGVQTGSTPETVQFTLPSGVSLSQVTSFTVIANGIPSNPAPALITPNVIAPPDQMGVEGASKAFNLGSFIDPDSSSWTVKVQWGDGSSDTFTTSSTGSLGTLNHTFSEEGSYTVTVSVTDNSNLTGSAKFNVSVSDPAVIASPTNITPVEGQDTGPVAVATFTDPGGSEVVGDYAASIDWGDGTTTTGTISFSSGVFSVIGDHTYAEESAPDHPGSNPYAITVTIQHETAPSAIAHSTAVVSDPAVAPTGGFTFNAVEGATSATQTVATFTDPGGPEPVGDYSATVNWNDGTPITTGTITFSSGTYTVQASHLYGEEGTYTVTIQIAHENAPVASTTSNAIVSDPAVIGTGTSLKAIACLPLVGVPVATFTDPGGAEPNPSDPSGTINNHYQVVSINWGDATPLDTSSGVLSFGGSPGSKTNPFTVSGTHSYASEGTYTITVVIAHEAAPTTTVMSSVVVRDNIGLLTLDPSGSGALTVTGNGGVVVNNCGAVVVDSSGPSAAILTGNGNVSAMDIDVTGGDVVTGNGTFIGGPLTHEPPTADFVSLPLPAAPSTTFPAVNDSSSTPLTLSPGTYIGGITLTGQANVTLLPGVYYLKGGGLKVSGQASLTGNGVLIVNAPATVNDGISFTGQGNITLTAPAALPGIYAPYAAVTIFQDPTSTAPFVISGGGGLTIDGILYAPAAALDMTGNGGLTDSTDRIAPVAAVIVYDAILTGNGALTINADALASNQSITPLPGAAQAIFTSLATSANPSVPGQPITITATMSAIPAIASPPAGVVDFFDQTTHLDLGFVTLSGGVASVTGSLKSLGGHVITANYFASSPNYAAPAPDPFTQTVQSEAIEGTSLFVGGTSGDVQVQLQKGNVVADTHDTSPQFTTPLAGLTALVVYAQDSAKIQVDSGLMLPAFLFAGDGNGAQIQAGGGPTVEVGGAGSGDVLTGGSGRTILIGGAGAAQLRAGSGGTILVGGTTDYDSNLFVLQVAQSLWSSAGSYAARMAALGSIFSAATVHGNGLVDQLRGGGGSTPLDWFFASALDQIAGNNPMDTVTPIL